MVEACSDELHYLDFVGTNLDYICEIFIWIPHFHDVFLEAAGVGPQLVICRQACPFIIV